MITELPDPESDYAESSPDPCAAATGADDVTITASEAMLIMDVAACVRSIPIVQTIVTAYLTGASWQFSEVPNLLRELAVLQGRAP